MKRKIGAALPLAVLGFACAPSAPVDAVQATEPQREAAIAGHFQRQQRLARIAGKIRIGGAPLCGEDLEPLLGVRLARLDDFVEESRPAMARVLGLAEAVTILAVTPGLPAERAGLVQGDVVLAIGGEGPRTTPQAIARLRELKGGPVDFRIGRGQETWSVIVEGVPACRFPVVLLPHESINALANGERVGVTTGMLDFLPDDDELAIVVGHELAHNLLRHPGGRPYPDDLPIAADTLGLYLTARGGFRVGGAPDLWRRLARTETEGSRNDYATIHPYTPERGKALEKTVRRIRAKRRAGAPLRPDPPR